MYQRIFVTVKTHNKQQQIKETWTESTAEARLERAMNQRDTNKSWVYHSFTPGIKRLNKNRLVMIIVAGKIFLIIKLENGGVNN